MFNYLSFANSTYRELVVKGPTRYESVGCDEENFSFPEEFLEIKADSFAYRVQYIWHLSPFNSIYLLYLHKFNLQC